MLFVKARRLSPFFEREAGDPLEFSKIAFNHRQPLSARLTGDQQIITAEQLPLPLEADLDVCGSASKTGP
jgi:hypothetical protein